MRLINCRYSTIVASSPHTPFVVGHVTISKFCSVSVIGQFYARSLYVQVVLWSVLVDSDKIQPCSLIFLYYPRVVRSKNLVVLYESIFIVPFMPQKRRVRVKRPLWPGYRNRAELVA